MTSGTILAFVIWCAVGLFFIVLGILSFFSKKAVGFWANANMFEVTDVKKYNCAMCKLYCTLGIVFFFLGFPLLSPESPLGILFSTIGVMFEAIMAMVIYTTVIEEKYKRK